MSGRAYTSLRAAAHAREGGRCAMCWQFVSLADAQCHHRKLRSQGGRDDLHNLVTLCMQCHGAVHRVPLLARRRGWLVPSWGDPAQWPCLTPAGWMQPGPDGWSAAEPSERQAAS